MTHHVICLVYDYMSGICLEYVFLVICQWSYVWYIPALPLAGNSESGLTSRWLPSNSPRATGHLVTRIGQGQRRGHACAACFQAHLATASRVLAVDSDAGCGLSTRGQWRGPVTCNEWEGGFSQCQSPYATLMCRLVPTFIMTFMNIIAILCPKLISLIVHQKNNLYNSSSNKIMTII